MTVTENEKLNIVNCFDWPHGLDCGAHACLRSIVMSIYSSVLKSSQEQRMLCDTDTQGNVRAE